MKKWTGARTSAGMSRAVNKKFFETSMDFCGSHVRSLSFVCFFSGVQYENEGNKRSVRVFL